MPALLENLLIRYARRFPVRRGKLRVIDTTWQLTAGARPSWDGQTPFASQRPIGYAEFSVLPSLAPKIPWSAVFFLVPEEKFPVLLGQGIS
jgi:hypothetical protein